VGGENSAIELFGMEGGPIPNTCSGAEWLRSAGALDEARLGANTVLLYADVDV
jgi:hypothetical protein